MEKKSFSISARLRSFKYAFRGIRVFIATEHNAWIHIFAIIIVCGAGIYFHINKIEWILIVLCSMGVIVTEAVNTAIETTVNIRSPEPNDLSRNAKDLAAGAVLIAAFCAVIIGGIIFIPKIASVF